MSDTIDEAVKRAFDKTVQDFEEACNGHHSGFWNEDTFRLDFFRHFSQEGLKMKRFFSEFPITLWGRKHIPDLVVHFETDDGLIMVAFEFKFYQQGWKEDWDKIRHYLEEGFKHGYFLGIGTETNDDLPNREEKVNENYAKAYVYHKASKEAFSLWPAFSVVEDLLKKTLDMPYTVSIMLQFAATIPEDYNIVYQAQEEKTLLLVNFSNEDNWSIIEKELAKLGLTKFVALDTREDEWNFEPSKTFKGTVLLAELPITSYPSTVIKAKEALFKLGALLGPMKPAFKIK
jgi:hypothetical protein